MKKLRWLAAPLVAVMLIGGTPTTASALEIKSRRIVMIQGHGSQSHYTCYYDYNWFENALGFKDGPRSGAACRR